MFRSAVDHSRLLPRSIALPFPLAIAVGYTTNVRGFGFEWGIMM